MNSRRGIIREICCCPDCYGLLSWESGKCICENCSAIYKREEGKILFQSSEIEKNFPILLLENETFCSRTINTIRKIVSSEYSPNRPFEKFSRSIDENDIIAECGAGNRRLSEQIITLDLYPFRHVDLVADIAKLPLKNQSTDVIVLDTVLEHVPEPQRCIDEAFRVLKKGGKVACITPFIFPYHAYPRHYQNFSEDGLRYLFRKFSDCHIETDMGPTSALINLFTEYVALSYKGDHPFFYTVLKGLALIPLFPFKYLDRLWCHSQHSKKIAMCLFALATK